MVFKSSVVLSAFPSSFCITAHLVDGNDNLLPMVSAPSSIDNDYVYIASVNRKFPQFGNSIDDEREAEEQPPEETTYPPPVFDFGMPRNITTRTGHTAAINCRVDNLGDKSVSESAGK